MEYYSGIKRSAFESVLMRWKNIESIIQSEVSQKEKNLYRRTDAEALILWPPDGKSQLTGKGLMLGKSEGRRRRGRQRMSCA